MNPVSENMLKSEDAEWREGFTDFGKWMDGWETRRKVYGRNNKTDPCGGKLEQLKLYE